MKFRKYFKILSCFSAAAVTGVMGAYGATSKAYAEPKFEGDRSSWYQMVFDGVKLPSSVDVANGDAFKIPVGGLNADDSVSVYDAAGQKHTYVKGQAVDESFFSLDGNTLTVDVLHDGTYYVVFTKSGYSSNAFKVVVSNSSYSLDLSGWNVSKVTEHVDFKMYVESKIITPWD